MLNNFWTRAPAFYFALGYGNSVASPGGSWHEDPLFIGWFTTSIGLLLLAVPKLPDNRLVLKPFPQDLPLGDPQTKWLQLSLEC